jgi:hypothetical protein
MPYSAYRHPLAQSGWPRRLLANSKADQRHVTPSPRKSRLRSCGAIVTTNHFEVVEVWTNEKHRDAMPVPGAHASARTPAPAAPCTPTGPGINQLLTMRFLRPTKNSAPSSHLHQVRPTIDACSRPCNRFGYPRAAICAARSTFFAHHAREALIEWKDDYNNAPAT